MSSKEATGKREPPSPAGTVSSSGGGGVESARIEADKFEMTSIQKAVEIVREVPADAPEELSRRLLAALEESLDMCIGELAKEGSSKTTCRWRPIVPISDTYLSLMPAQGLASAVEVKMAATGDSSFTLQVVMVLSRALDRLDSSRPQDWATRAKAAGSIEDILPMDLKALCHVYRTPFNGHWTTIDASLAAQKDPDASSVSEEEMKNLWELWERIWPGDTKNLSEKEKKDCVVDLMKARAFISQIQYALRQMPERPQETSGPFKTPSDVKQLTNDLRNAVYSVLHVTKPGAVGEPNAIKRADVPVEFSVQAASLPELALALTDYTVMRRMAAHILIKAHSACNRIWDCKRDTPDFRAQLQHRREVFHPVVDLRRMIHNVFGSSFSSLADYLLRKETHWLGWKGIAVSKEVCGPFLHSTHRERFGTPWPPSCQTKADVVIGDDTLPTKRKSADRSSESPSPPPSKRTRHSKAVPRHVERMLQMLHEAADASAVSPYAPSPESSPAGSDEEVEEESQCEKYMNKVMQHDDPEEGIEEDYRCYNNKIFQWQLRRMLARSHIECYNKKAAPVSNDAAKDELIELVPKRQKATERTPSTTARKDDKKRYRHELAVTAEYQDTANATALTNRAKLELMELTSRHVSDGRDDTESSSLNSEAVFIDLTVPVRSAKAELMAIPGTSSEFSYDVYSLQSKEEEVLREIVRPDEKGSPLDAAADEDKERKGGRVQQEEEEEEAVDVEDYTSSPSCLPSGSSTTKDTAYPSSQPGAAAGGIVVVVVLN
ncbi:hypothetical protein Pmar_PMAR000190 [Perkinsus marinus ATCC 50983]|uniref:Uncharacterized protein n=1 Tax=Perkinsus marinus (strain ATCC 50983 / TXsc) TaxID=423536 RepID=C5K8Q0_PERM5|nr:hypothetical protein Pmar_PMAR000190 [Perkinsus marinus ATCC 50983]EER19127.1 hypothetical protein Pmar_PMAR000190 [Perkinsus marinus ATCC 50983]|eukprot:XP_002787331.1 hypothetical protein Pmar_PMAR000190 [Perkinsus marinus ATCC 50983]